MKTNLRKDLMIKNAKINSIDDRGWYIVSGGISGGVDYLYNDGIIREGVCASSARSSCSSGFWPTEEAAQSFFKNWKNDDNEFWDGLGMT